MIEAAYQSGEMLFLYLGGSWGVFARTALAAHFVVYSLGSSFDLSRRSRCERRVGIGIRAQTGCLELFQQDFLLRSLFLQQQV